MTAESSSVIVDASVAAKWFFDEPGADAARALLSARPVVAPDLIAAEITNIIWKRAMAGGATNADAVAAQLSILLDRVVPSMPLMAVAAGLSVALRHPAHDCFYLALAIAEDAELVTADRRFVAACIGTPHEARVRLL